MNAQIQDTSMTWYAEKILDTWYTIHGTWYMVHVSWYMVHCTRFMVHGTRYMVHCTWYTDMVHGTRYMVHGTWYTLKGFFEAPLYPSPNCLYKNGNGHKKTEIRPIYFRLFFMKASLREAFQTKKRGNLGNGPNRGGFVNKSKKCQVSVGKSSKLGGVLQKSKKSKVPEGVKDWKIMTPFNLLRNHKTSDLSIVVLKHLGISSFLFCLI